MEKETCLDSNDSTRRKYTKIHENCNMCESWDGGRSMLLLYYNDEECGVGRFLASVN